MTPLKLISVAVSGSLVAALGVAGNAQAANLIFNGSFENGVYPGRDYLTLNPGSSAIDGWTVEEGTIDYISSFWQSADGNRSLDIDYGYRGTGAGGIAQTFSTEIGKNYLVTFDIAGNPGLPRTTNVKKLLVEAAGQSSEFSFDVTDHTFSNMGWESHFWQFTAVNSETTIKFSNHDPGSYVAGVALDNVSVVATPESTEVPEFSSALSLLAVVLLGAGFRLKRKPQ